jgi:hypothetical protein
MNHQPGDRVEIDGQPGRLVHAFEPGLLAHPHRLWLFIPDDAEPTDPPDLISEIQLS